MTRRATLAGRACRSRRGGPALRESGFTLLELLVALFIAALMFAMGYGAIRQAANSREALQQQQARLLEVQTAMRVLEQDFMQLAPRPIRAPVGYSWVPALQATATTQPVVQLTRAGWTNPNGLQRPGLQRVAYFYENGTLRREYWTVLDPTQSSTTLKRDLITKLKAVQFRFMDPSKAWQDQWPPATSTQGTFQQQMMLRGRPIGVEITLDTEDMGKLVRILEIPG
jgi:general secretion pathway protein J